MNHKHQIGETVEWDVKIIRNRTKISDIIFIIISCIILYYFISLTKEQAEIKQRLLEKKEEAVVPLSIVETEFLPTQTKKVAPVKVNKPEKKSSRLLIGTDYTPYQVAMWYLKSHESFRPWAYPDGKYPSKGFGLNLTPAHTTWASKVLGFPAKSRDWTWDEGMKVLTTFWQEKHNSFSDKGVNNNQRIAVMLHSYNRGKTTDIRGCCGRKVGCGSKNKKIRNSHNPRREFEWKLYNGQITNKDVELLREDALKTEIKWKRVSKN